MTDEEIQALDKEVKKLKRIASEWASQLHDLVEDRLHHHRHAHRGLDGPRPANHGHPRHDVRYHSSNLVF